MTPKMITMREFYREFSRIVAQARQGQRFTVTEHDIPLFRIEPPEEDKQPIYTIKDFSKAQFKGDKNLSKDIDKILCG